MTQDEMKVEIWNAAWATRGEAPTQKDYDYWLGLFPGLLARGDEIHFAGGGLGYARERMLGWQSSGTDIPKYGKYAVPETPYHDVPPYPGTEAPAPAPVAVATLSDLLNAVHDVRQFLTSMDDDALEDFGAVMSALDKIQINQNKQADRIEAIRGEFIKQVQALAPQVGFIGRLFGRG
jgi:hypothetical protein